MKPNKSHSWIIPLLVTILVHTLVLALLYFLVLEVERPVRPQEEIVLIDIGNVPEAQGAEEPMGSEAQDDQSPQSPATANEPVRPPEPKPITDPKPISPKKPEIKPKDSNPIKTQTHEESLKRLKAEAEARIKAEAERKAKLLAEAQARTEREAKERAEREAQEREAKRRQASASVSNAFGAGRTANASQGNGTGSGNQGDPSGVAGGSFSLEGRRIVSNGGKLTSPRTNRAIEGRVVVSIVVDSRGTITTASISPRGTTIADAAVRAEALRAAKATTFNPQEGAESQKGTITYIYVIKE